MATTNDGKKAQGGNGPALNRRQALARLGLGISIAYATPMLLGLREARASGGSGGEGGGNEGGHGSGPGNDHASGSSGPSHDDVAQLSGPTSPSGPDDESDDNSGPSGTILFGEPGSGQP